MMMNEGIYYCPQDEDQVTPQEVATQEVLHLKKEGD